MNYQSKHIKGVPYFATSNNVNQVINMLDQLIFDLQAELTALSNSSLYIGSNVALFPTSGITINKLGIDTSTRKLYSFNGVTWNQVTISNDGKVPVNTVAPEISGDVGVGNKLTCSKGTWTSDTGIKSYEYQWCRDDVDIAGANFNGYDITGDDVDTILTCIVRACNSDGCENAISNSILIATVPECNVLPSISGEGELIVGQVLTTDDGVWDAIGTITYSYQWKRGGETNINIGTNANTYTLVKADAGQTITCEVTATTLAGSASATSNSVYINVI
jgi:hypothetical protein